MFQTFVLSVGEQMHRHGNSCCCIYLSNTLLYNNKACVSVRSAIGSTSWRLVHSSNYSFVLMHFTDGMGL